MTYRYWMLAWVESGDVPESFGDERDLACWCNFNTELSGTYYGTCRSQSDVDSSTSSTWLFAFLATFLHVKTHQVEGANLRFAFVCIDNSDSTLRVRLTTSSVAENIPCISIWHDDSEEKTTKSTSQMKLGAMVKKSNSGVAWDNLQRVTIVQKKKTPMVIGT